MAITIGVLHLARHASIEYSQHEFLASYADPQVIESRFLWQVSSTTQKSGSPLQEADAISSHPQHQTVNIGRDYSINPKPSRRRRQFMFATRIPIGLIAVARWLRDIKPDAIYTSQQDIDVVFGKFFSRLMRIPHIIHIHYQLGPWWSRNTLRIIRRADHVFVVSNFIRDSAIENGVSPDAVRTVHNPLDVRRFSGTRLPAYLHEQFGIPLTASVIVSAGRLVPGKGIDTAIAAFAQLADRYPDSFLIICGEPFASDAYSADLRTTAAASGHSDQIIFAGFRDDLPEIFAASDIFCLPAIGEAFGMVFIEAMASGLPVVACDSGGVPEIVRSGVDGFLVPPADVSAVSEALARLLDDATLRQTMGRAARKSVRERFDPTEISQRWQSDLVEMLSSVVHGSCNRQSASDDPTHNGL